MEIRPLEENDIPSASAFLTRGFEPESAGLFSEDFLRWKYVDPRGGGDTLRSLIALREGHVTGHIGLCPTFFEGAFPDRVPAGGLMDWLATHGEGPVGLALLMKAYRSAPVLYTIGGTAQSRRVFESTGFSIVSQIPEFCKPLSPYWYGSGPLWRKAARATKNFGRSIRYRTLPPAHDMEVRTTPGFEDDSARIVESYKRHASLTFRGPEVLNHFLRCPEGTFSGCLLSEDGQLVGHTLLNVVLRSNIRIARIVDCVLSSCDSELWAAAVYHIVAHIRNVFDCDLVTCLASVPWFTEGLSRNGFYVQKHMPFYLRDPKSKVPLDAPFHLSQLDVDCAYL